MNTMKGFGITKRFEEFGLLTAEKPVCGPFDAICEPVALAACTSDPHQVHAGIREGMVLGHEAVGRIIEVGSFVKDFKVGDVVALPCTTPDWLGLDNQDNIPQHCTGENTGMNWCVEENGTFAEQFRVRQVDLNAAFIPDGLCYDDALMASDMITTGLSGAELANIQFGDTVAVVGIGPVGLMSVAGAKLRGASRIIGIGRRPLTMELAGFYGATDVVNYTEGSIDEQVLELLNGKKPDCVIVAGGDQEAFMRAVSMTKANGYIANLVGQTFEVVLPRKATHSNCAHKHIVGGLCPGGRRRIERMMSLVKTGRIDPKPLITAHFNGFEHILDAYNMMDHKTDDNLKPVVYT